MLKKQSRKGYDDAKSYQDFDEHNSKNKEVKFDKLMYLGFTSLELSNFYM